jgi:hypothetical protein
MQKKTKEKRGFCFLYFTAGARAARPVTCMLSVA